MYIYLNCNIYIYIFTLNYFLKDLGCTKSVSPVVTRSMARTASKTLDTPETILHHEMSDSPTLDMISLDINHASLLDTAASATEVNSLHDSSVTSHDSEAESNPRPEHGDDVTRE